MRRRGDSKYPARNSSKFDGQQYGTTGSSPENADPTRRGDWKESVAEHLCIVRQARIDSIWKRLCHPLGTLLLKQCLESFDYFGMFLCYVVQFGRVRLQVEQPRAGLVATVV